MHQPAQVLSVVLEPQYRVAHDLAGAVKGHFSSALDLVDSVPRGGVLHIEEHVAHVWASAEGEHGVVLGE